MKMNNACEEKTECDSITALELQKSKRILYFSDGTLEELSESEGEDIAPDITDKANNESIQLTNLPLGSRIRYQAYLIGNRLLHGVDYIGEGLAGFFGITNPKYLSESDIENAKNNFVVTDLDNISHNNEGWGWHHNNNENSPNIDVTRFSQRTVNNAT